MNKRGDGDLVATYMRGLAAATEAGDRPLPPAPALAWRARLLAGLSARDAAAERASRPVLLAALVGPFTTAAVLSALLGSRWPVVAAAVLASGAIALAVGLPVALADE